jgi:hypothetical protein
METAPTRAGELVPPLNAPSLTSQITLTDVPTQQQHAMKMALAEAVAGVINSMLSSAHVMPGIATSLAGFVPGMPGAPLSGVTTGPGRITMMPLVGVLVAQEVSRRTAPLKLDAGQAKVLNDMLVKALELTHEAFKDIMVLPGIPVSMAATAGPGKLLSPSAATLASTLSPALMSMEPRAWIPPAPVMGRTGQFGPCLPKKLHDVVGKLVGNAARSAIEQAMVMPGIPLAMGVTVGQGRIG